MCGDDDNENDNEFDNDNNNDNNYQCYAHLFRSSFHARYKQYKYNANLPAYLNYLNKLRTINRDEDHPLLMVCGEIARRKRNTTMATALKKTKFIKKQSQSRQEDVSSSNKTPQFHPFDISSALKTK